MRKYLYKILIGFFVIIFICTIIAGNIYNSKLPIVSTGTIKKDHLRQQYNISATVNYDYTVHSYHAVYDFSEIKLLVQTDDTVKPGTPLYSVPDRDIILAEKSLQLTILELEQQNESIISNGTKINTTDKMNQLRYEINQNHIITLEEKLDNVKQIRKSDNIVKADTYGKITYTATNGASVQSGSSVVVVNEYKNKAKLVWQMKPSDGKLFNIGDSINVLLSILVKQVENKDPISKTAFYQLKISNKKYSDSLCCYLFEVTLNKKDINGELNMENGEQADIILNYVSKEEYDYVIPLSAITFEDKFTGYVFQIQKRQRVFGEERYVIPLTIEIMDMTDSEAALTNAVPNTDIVVSTSKPLSDNKAVKIK